MSNQVRLAQVVVEDLTAATNAFTTFLGPPTVSDDTMNGTVSYRVAGLGVLELVTPNERANDPLRVAVAARLRSKGEGLVTLGIEVDDVRQHQRDLEKLGIRFLMSEPRTASSGAWNATTADTTHGVFMKLSEGIGDLAREAGSRTAAEAPPLARAYVIYVAVRDLAIGAATFGAVFGEEGISMAEGMASPALHAMHFPLEGLYALGVIALRDEPKAADARRFASYLAMRGDGGALLGFLVDDLDAVQEQLRSFGVDFEFAKPIVHSLGRITWTKPVHGVTIALTQHDDGSYSRWRAQGREK